MEEKTTETQDNKSEMAKRWIQDNLRIIVSVIIVVAIAGGIYSYSKRTENVATNVENSEEIATMIEEGAKNEGAEKTSEEQSEEGVNTSEESQTEQPQSEQSQAPNQTPSSKETETSFVETAGQGEGTTHLARRALANYLEKNPDSELTKEHKIYIEDMLRKQVSNQGLQVGSSVEFSKSMISDAIGQSKQLTENQLQNLQKYSARVASLT